MPKNDNSAETVRRRSADAYRPYDDAASAEGRRRAGSVVEQNRTARAAIDGVNRRIVRDDKERDRARGK